MATWAERADEALALMLRATSGQLDLDCARRVAKQITADAEWYNDDEAILNARVGDFKMLRNLLGHRGCRGTRAQNARSVIDAIARVQNPHRAPRYVAHYWREHLLGRGRHEPSGVVVFRVTDRERQEFPELAGRRRVALYRSSRGRVVEVP